MKDTLHVDATQLVVDSYNNIFFSDSRQNVYKLSSDEVISKGYSVQNNGAIDLKLKDATRITVFYPELQTVKYLDRFLSEKQSLELIDYDLTFASIVCPALDGNLWAFDEGRFELAKLNIQTSDKIVELSLTGILPEESRIIDMYEYQNLLFLLDYEKGVHVFDNMGGYKNTYLLEDISLFAFGANQMIYVEGQNLKVFDLYNFTTKFVIEKEVIDMTISGNLLYLLQDKEIIIYQFDCEE